MNFYCGASSKPLNLYSIDYCEEIYYEENGISEKKDLID